MPLADPDWQYKESEFAPPRSKQRLVPTPLDPPIEFRERFSYPYGDEYEPDDAA